MSRKMKLKKNDTVKVISGRDKGKTGKVLRVENDRDRLIVEGINMVKKTKRPQSQNDKGGIIDIEAPIHMSNVMLVTKDGKTTRAGYRYDNKEKVRFAKKTGEVL